MSIHISKPRIIKPTRMAMIRRLPVSPRKAKLFNIIELYHYVYALVQGGGFEPPKA